MHKSNIQPRLQQRRAAGQDVLSYVGNILECEGGKPDPSVTLDDFRPFLTDDEINSYEKMLKERMRAEAEARAKAETEAKARKEAWEQEQAMFRTLSPDQQDAEITK